MLSHASIVIPLLATLACDRTPVVDQPAFPLPTHYYVMKVYGTISGTPGVRLPDADVTITSLEGSCSSGTQDGRILVKADSTGRYNGTMAGSDRNVLRCVIVEVSGIAGSGTARAEAVRFPFRFATDSVRIDIVVK
jgi:hypothetical protein